jgi:cell division protein FtsL
VTKLNVALALAVLLSAMVLVKSTYESRRLFTALDRAQQEERSLDADRQRLEAERQAAATTLRVERAARDRLAMRPATPGITQYLTDPGTAK